LKELPNLKVAFFVSEETGCHGSRKADPEFFKNVGYAIQFDAPGNSIVSEYCMGVKLYETNGDFFNGVHKVLTERFEGRNRYYSHPYTDVYALRQKFDFSCINFSIGYYDYHSRNEYVVIEDVYNGIRAGKEIIDTLGYKKYQYETKKREVF
jgi:di/tripeptidase